MIQLLGIIAVIFFVACGGSPEKDTETDSQSPNINILLPTDGSLYSENTTITLQVEVTHPDGEIIPEDTIVWYSDRDGLLGSGSSLTVDNLSLGQHYISVEVQDQFQSTTRATVTITISPVDY